MQRKTRAIDRCSSRRTRDQNFKGVFSFRCKDVPSWPRINCLAHVKHYASDCPVI